jgi:hypothetical protein
MNTRGRQLTLQHAAPIPDGPLLGPSEIASAVFRDNVSARWVLDNVPRHYRHPVGRKVLYFESEVRAWARSLREVA